MLTIGAPAGMHLKRWFDADRAYLEKYCDLYLSA